MLSNIASKYAEDHPVKMAGIDSDGNQFAGTFDPADTGITSITEFDRVQQPAGGENTAYITFFLDGVILTARQRNDYVYIYDASNGSGAELCSWDGTLLVDQFDVVYMHREGSVVRVLTSKEEMIELAETPPGFISDYITDNTPNNFYPSHIASNGAGDYILTAVYDDRVATIRDGSASEIYLTPDADSFFLPLWYQDTWVVYYANTDGNLGMLKADADFSWSVVTIPDYTMDSYYTAAGGIGDDFVFGVNGGFVYTSDFENWTGPVAPAETLADGSNNSFATAVVMGDDLLIGTFSDGYYVSSDKGTTWSEATMPASYNVDFEVMMPDFTTPEFWPIFEHDGKYHVCTLSGGIWEYANGVWAQTLTDIYMGDVIIGFKPEAMTAIIDGLDWPENSYDAPPIWVAINDVIYITGLDQESPSVYFSNYEPVLVDGPNKVRVFYGNAMSEAYQGTALGETVHWGGPKYTVGKSYVMSSSGPIMS